MNGTRFMVIKLKELIKTAIFAVLGVIIIIGLIYFFLPKNNSTAKYEPGTYTSEVALNGGTAFIEITVDSDEIKSISLKETSETLPVFYPLLAETAEELGSEIVKNQSLDVAISSETAYTSEMLLDAVHNGLAQAVKQ